MLFTSILQFVQLLKSDIAQATHSISTSTSSYTTSISTSPSTSTRTGK